MPTIALADIVFSEQANHNFSKILGDLKRSNLSLTNRLTSILQDAAFVSDVASSLRLPLVANERCGSWYIKPGQIAASAYFKSTDGHQGQWNFSTRRLNLHLLELISRHDGCIIVDSTRRGKLMPDALSKTVPIWCSVLNRVLFPDDASCHELHVPSVCVSVSEKSQMQARLPELVKAFEDLDMNLSPLRQVLRRPLRPVWLIQNGDAPDLAGRFSTAFFPVVCCTSSRRVLGTEMSEGGYIQGAGDDTENWAHGLTAPMFWYNREQLLSTPEPELERIISHLVAHAESGLHDVQALQQVAPYLYVGLLSACDTSSASGSCVITLNPTCTLPESWVKSKYRMEAGLGKSKAASRQLRQALPHICDFALRYFGEEQGQSRKTIAIYCPSGRDLSIGVALALYCRFFDPHANLHLDGHRTFTKAAIRAKLGHIMTAMPGANPNRATLQSVNSFLMGWQQ